MAPKDTQDEQAVDGEADAPVDSLHNDTIEHSEGGRTTRSDATDLGAPMKADAPEGYVERPGPEDVFGDEPTRGDYSDRTNTGPHVRMERVPDGERDNTELSSLKGGRGLDGAEPGANVRPVEQAPGS